MERKCEKNMVELNERAKEYLSRVKWQHVVLNIEEITS